MLLSHQRAKQVSLETRPPHHQPAYQLMVTQRKTVKRCLFGRSDPGEVEGWQREKLAEIQKENERKYNFNFVTETPGTSGDWEWTTAAGKEIPDFYKPKLLPKSKVHPTTPKGLPPSPRKRSAASSSSPATRRREEEPPMSTPKKPPSASSTLRTGLISKKKLPHQQLGRRQISHFFNQRKRSQDVAEKGRGDNGRNDSPGRTARFL